MKTQEANLKLDWCNYKMAKYAVQNWHYSKSMPTPPHNLIGVWEYNKFIGVVIFSRGATNNIGKPYNLKQSEVCELTRVALSKHTTPVTRIVSIAIKILKRHNPGIKLIISFADQNQNHKGTIYKAGNWLRAGETAKSFIYIDKNGKRFHPRQVSPSGYKKQYGNYRTVPKPSQLETLPQLPKYRFLYILDNSLRVELESKALDYQSKESGAVPTNTHHKGFL